MRRCRTSWTVKNLSFVSIAASLGVVCGKQHFDYDEDLAKLAVIYSSAAYQRVSQWSFANPACNDKTKGFTLEQSYVGEHTDAFGYVGVDHPGERIVVAFKGTSDLHDWVTNLRTWVHYNNRCAPARDPGKARRPPLSPRDDGAVPRQHRGRRRAPQAEAEGDLRGEASEVGDGGSGGGERWADYGAALREEGRGQFDGAGEADEDEDELLIGNVHFGFCEFYQSLVAKGIDDQVLHLARHYATYTIFVTGHSLGAAAAAVCAADLVQRVGLRRERVILYTLGEPRTGDGLFALGVSDHVGTAYRVVHNRDVVPHLSLCCHGWLGKCLAAAATCPYQHSTEVLYTNNMTDNAPWVLCNDSIGEDYECDPQSWDMSVADHVHYFGWTVGLYCDTRPEDMTPFPLAQEQERARWAPYEVAMRQTEATLAAE